MAEGKRVIARIDGFAIDCIVNESHERESDVTSVPVESGTPATDSIVKKNRTCTIEGIVTDTPAAEMVSERNLTQDDEVITTQAACDTLESAWDQERTVVVETPMFTYKNCAIRSLTMPRDAKTGRALKFTAKFEEIRIRQTLRVSVPVTVRASDSRALPKKNLGKKAGKNINNARYTVRKGDTAYVTDYGNYKGGANDPMSFEEFTKKKIENLGHLAGQASAAGHPEQVQGFRDEAKRIELEYRSREGLSKAAQVAEDHPVLSGLAGFGNLPAIFNSTL